MPLHYERWLIARGNVFLPSAVSVAKVIEKLREERWVSASGGSAVRTIANDFGDDTTKREKARREDLPSTIDKEWLDNPDREEIRLIWPGNVDLGYPLSIEPDSASWSIEVHRAPEYVYPVADTIKRIDTECACGEELDFEWDEEEVVPAFENAIGIFAECDECSRTFDPAKKSATIKNPFDGSAERVAGGAAYRFALKVDCGSSYVSDPKLAFAPKLVALVEKEFGRSFYEVGALRKA